MKIKPLQNGEITLSFTDVCKSCPCHKSLMWQICLSVILGNTILPKISGTDCLDMTIAVDRDVPPPPPPPPPKKKKKKKTATNYQPASSHSGP